MKVRLGNEVFQRHISTALPIGCEVKRLGSIVEVICDLLEEEVECWLPNLPEDKLPDVYLSGLEKVKQLPPEKNPGIRKRAENLIKCVVLDESRAKEALQIIELFLSCHIKVTKGVMQPDIKQWILRDKDGNKAGLYLGSGFGWSLDGLRVDQELAGFFDMDLNDFLACNDIEID